MSDAIGRGDYALGADDSQLRKAFADAEALARRSGQTVESAFGKQASQGLAKADTQARSLRGTLMGMVRSPELKKGILAGLGLGAGMATFMAVQKGMRIVKDAIKGAIKGAIDAAADLDDAMTKSLAIMGDVSDSMRGEMTDAARTVARETTFSATQAADAYFFLASAGLDAAQSLEAMPRVARFAQAGNFDLARATDLLTDAQSALGLTIRDNTVKNMENMTRVSDVLVKANTVANATVEQFAESLTNRGAAALKLVNKEMEEGVAVLAAWADQGVKGSEAGTRLDIVLRDLQQASIKNTDQFKKFGIEVFDAQGNMNSLADIIEDLEGALGSMSDRQRRAALMTLGFQSRSISATTSLLGLSGAVREYEGELRNAAGTTKTVAEKQLESFRAKAALLDSAITDLGISIGNELIPHLINLMDIIRGPQGAEAAVFALAASIRAAQREAEGGPPVLDEWTDAASRAMRMLQDLRAEAEQPIDIFRGPNVPPREALDWIDALGGPAFIADLNVSLGITARSVIDLAAAVFDAGGDIDEFGTRLAIVMRTQSELSAASPGTAGALVGVGRAADTARAGVDRLAGAFDEAKTKADAIAQTRGIKAINDELRRQIRIRNEAAEAGRVGDFFAAQAAIKRLREERELRVEGRDGLKEWKRIQREKREATQAATQAQKREFIEIAKAQGVSGAQARRIWRRSHQDMDTAVEKLGKVKGKADEVGETDPKIKITTPGIERIKARLEAVGDSLVRLGRGTVIPISFVERHGGAFDRLGRTGTGARPDFHSGTPYVPNTGWWYLERGERVISKEANQAMMSGVGGPQAGGGHQTVDHRHSLTLEGARNLRSAGYDEGQVARLLRTASHHAGLRPVGLGGR